MNWFISNFLTLLLIFPSFSASVGAINYNIDSSHKADSLSVSKYIELSNVQSNINYPNALKLGKHALLSSEKSDCHTCRLLALKQMGILYWINGKYDSSIYYLNQVIVNVPDHAHNDFVADANHNIALNYYYMADYPRAIEFYESAQKDYISLGDTAKLIKVLTHIGLVYNKQGDYVNSIHYLLESSRLREALIDDNSDVYNLIGAGPSFKDEKYYQNELSSLIKKLDRDPGTEMTSQKAKIFHNIGLCHYHLDNYEEAIRFLRSTVTIMDSLGYIPYWNDLGRAYRKAKKYDSARIAHENAINITKERGTRISLSTSYEALGDLYFEIKDYPEAINVYQKANSLHEDMNNMHSVAILKNKIADANLRNSNPVGALIWAESAYEIALAINHAVAKSESLFLLSSIYATLGRYNEAYNYGKAYSKLKNSLENGESTYQLAQMEVQYEIEKKAREIEQLSQENKINEAEIAHRGTFIFGSVLVICLMLFLSLILYLLYLTKQKTSKILAAQKERLEVQHNLLETKNKENEMLLGEIHHRVKNNLQVITSLLSIQSSQLKESEAKQAIQIGKNRVQAMGLIHENLYQLKNFNAINMANYFNQLSMNLLLAFGYDPDAFNLKVITNNIALDVDTAIPLGLIANELITNALKYAFVEIDHPSLIIQLFEKEKGQLCFEVLDNGVGIKKELSSKSFGLKLVKELTRKLKGEMIIENKNGTLICLLISKYKIAA